MGKYIGKRIINALIVLLVATVCIFIMIKATGMNPVLATLEGGGMTDAALKARMARYGLDKPVIVQYFYWLVNILHGNFGESVKYKVSVSSLIRSSFPVTLFMVLVCFAVSQVLAILLGTISALQYGRFLDRLIQIVTLVLFSVPIFFMGMLFILVLTRVFPGFEYTGSINSIHQMLSRMLVPIIIMCMHEIALVTKITRSSMIEQLSSDYVLALRARGVSEGKIVFRHALKNSMIPVITVAGIQFGSLFVGCVMVENIFSLNGLGRLMVQSVTVGDVAVIQGVSLIVILAFLISNIIVDILHALIDPRIREQEEGNAEAA